MPRKKPRVYLAGPISGCNDDQIRSWRIRVKDRWSDEFEFIDPTEEIVEHEDHASHAIVRKDEQAIKRADAVLANMWRESIGTAIGVSLARTRGKTVVVADPNHLNSKILAYYADAVTDTVTIGMKTLRALLRSQQVLQTIVKLDGHEEPFDREKLVRSIRAACRTAGQSDILAPAEIVPLVLERLTRAKPVRKGAITTTQVKNAVWDVLAELEADPLKRVHFSGIREAWEQHESKRRPAASRSRTRGAIQISRKPLQARVFSGKSHASIWGKAVKQLADIPQPARRGFKEILRVHGIAEIRLTKTTSGHVDGSGVRLEVLASRDQGIIEGKCHHNAPKGQVQMFQIKVHEPEQTEAIRQALVEHLGKSGLLKVGTAGG